jgi:DNA (cytosine-5)-methyltransferase 1
MTYKVLDLFSGIGGFSLGLERTGGFETVAFCEIEKFPQKVLAKHWPEVPIYEDVRSIHGVSNTNAARMEESRVDKAAQGNGKERRDYERGSRGDGRWIAGTCADGEDRTVGPIDVITGGFPCQDISVAGKQKGIGEGTRSGLWSECARLLGEIRPDYAIFENVTALLSGDSGRWFQRVLWDISEVGYDAEWHCISASELGAHHHRDRVWIICYPQHAGRTSSEIGESNQAGDGSNEKGQEPASEFERSGDSEVLADPNSKRTLSGSREIQKENGEVQKRDNDPESNNSGESSGNVADTERSRQQGQGEYVKPLLAEAIKNWKTIDAESGCVSGIWKVESRLGRVVDGLPDRTHRLKGLGNAVVPQIPELIGRAILEAKNVS